MIATDNKPVNDNNDKRNNNDNPSRSNANESPAPLSLNDRVTDAKQQICEFYRAPIVKFWCHSVSLCTVWVKLNGPTFIFVCNN